MTGRGPNSCFFWSRDTTTPLPSRKTLSAFRFQSCQPFQQYVLHCTRYRASK